MQVYHQSYFVHVIKVSQTLNEMSFLLISGHFYLIQSLMNGQSTEIEDFKLSGQGMSVRMNLTLANPTKDCLRD